MKMLLTVLVMLVFGFTTKAEAAIVITDLFHKSIDAGDLDEDHLGAVGYAIFTMTATTTVDAYLYRLGTKVTITSAQTGLAVTPRLLSINMNTTEGLDLPMHFRFSEGVTQSWLIAVWFVMPQTGVYKVTVDSATWLTTVPGQPTVETLGYTSEGVFLQGVPEPTTFTLSLCALGLGLIRRR